MWLTLFFKATVIKHLPLHIWFLFKIRGHWTYTFIIESIGHSTGLRASFTLGHLLLHTGNQIHTSVLRGGRSNYTSHCAGVIGLAPAIICFFAEISDKPSWQTGGRFLSKTAPCSARRELRPTIWSLIKHRQIIIRSRKTSLLFPFTACVFFQWASGFLAPSLTQPFWVEFPHC